MATTTQRKAWNEAMRSAAGGTLLIPTMDKNTTRRSSDRRKRREKARKSTTWMHSDSHADSSFGSNDIRQAIRLDCLEGCTSIIDDAVDDTEEYDELEDLESKSRKKTKPGPKKKSDNVNAKKKRAKAHTGILPTRFKAKSLSSILIEESATFHDNATNYIKAEARSTQLSVHSMVMSTSMYPMRKFCPVTGLEGLYTDPKSGIPYSNLDALEQIRDRPPPWMAAFGAGSALYFETIQSIRPEH